MSSILFSHRWDGFIPIPKRGSFDASLLEQHREWRRKTTSRKFSKDNLVHVFDEMALSKANPLTNKWIQNAVLGGGLHI